LTRSSKADADRLFRNLFGGERLVDTSRQDVPETTQEDVPFDATDVPNFAKKKIQAAELDQLFH